MLLSATSVIVQRCRSDSSTLEKVQIDTLDYWKQCARLKEQVVVSFRVIKDG